MLPISSAARLGALVFTMASAGAAYAATTPYAAPNYTFANGSEGFAFTTTGGRLDPEVLVDFNPQPDPPGFGGSQDLTPFGGRVTQIATPLSDTGYGFLIALLNVGPGGMTALPPAPDTDGNTGLTFLGEGAAFRLTLNFAGPGEAIDWAAFNPQPDPPGIWFGAQFNYATLADPVVTFALTEGDRPLSLALAPIPEPAPWALMLIGVGGIGGWARTRRQSQASTTTVWAGEQRT